MRIYDNDGFDLPKMGRFEEIKMGSSNHHNNNDASIMMVFAHKKCSLFHGIAV